LESIEAGVVIHPAIMVELPNESLHKTQEIRAILEMNTKVVIIKIHSTSLFWQNAASSSIK
jgi:hypothetical protein